MILGLVVEVSLGIELGCTPWAGATRALVNWGPQAGAAAVLVIGSLPLW